MLLFSGTYPLLFVFNLASSIILIQFRLNSTRFRNHETWEQNQQNSDNIRRNVFHFHFAIIGVCLTHLWNIILYKLLNIDVKTWR